MTLTLDKLEKGSSGRIVAVNGDDVLTQRVMAMGLLPGNDIRVVGIAPMGDPITVEGPTGRISLRKAEASALVIESISSTSQSSEA